MQYEGRTIPIAQCNNVFIFPAVGLGVVASGARRVTDGMMLAAARALGEHSPARTDPSGSLLPALRDVRAVARAIATAVGLEAQRAGVAPGRAPRSSATGSRPRSGRRSIPSAVPRSSESLLRKARQGSRARESGSRVGRMELGEALFGHQKNQAETIRTGSKTEPS